MQLFSYTQTITTAVGGAATVNFGQKILGRIIAILYQPGTIATGAGLTITGATSGVPILTKANAGTSDAWFNPATLVNDSSDGSLATDFYRDIYVFDEKIKLVVASGGDEKTGSMTIYTEE